MENRRTKGPQGQPQSQFAEIYLFFYMTTVKTRLDSFSNPSPKIIPDT